MLIALCLPKDPVGCPHEGGHAVLVLHVDVLALGDEVGDEGRVTKLSRQVNTAAALTVAQGGVATELHQDHHHLKMALSVGVENRRN